MNRTIQFVKLFENTTTSYKYLFLKALITRVFDCGSAEEGCVLRLQDIVIDILVYAWYPNQYFRLSFGAQDKISAVFTEQDFTYNSNIPITSTLFEQQLRKEIVRAIDSKSLEKLTTYVQYRILHPFFDEELRGQKDHVKNRMIRELAIAQYDIVEPLYKIDQHKKTIEIHPEWFNFIKRNSLLLLQYTEFRLAEFLQKHNPNVPAVLSKTSPPKQRASLTTQTRYWRDFMLSHKSFRCIYSSNKVQLDNFSLDHFLPWSYVCHDRIWNLTPTTQEVNSSKGNSLPALEQYLEPFVDYQTEAIYFHSKNSSYWPSIKLEMMSDLGLDDEKAIYNEKLFQRQLTSTLKNQFSVAKQLGFKTGWSFNQ